MALKKRYLFIFGILVIFIFSTCNNSPSDPEPKESDFPQSVNITAPSASTTYWDDEPVACAANPSDYADKTTWLVDGEAVSCVDGELAENLSTGEHSVTARIAA